MKNDALWVISENDNYKELLFERKLDFESSFDNSQTKESSISKLYENLNLDFKKYVLNIIDDLCQGNDNVGYNVERIIKTFQNNDMKQYSVANIIYEKEKKNSSHIYYDKTRKKINNQIDKIKKNAIIKTDTIMEDTLKQFCDNYLVSMDLVQKGYGKIFEVNPNYISKLKVVGEKSIKLKDGNSFLSVLRACEQVMKEDKIITNDEDWLIREKYVVMTRNGQYLGLDQKNKIAINNLIKNLYNFQQKNAWKDIVISRSSDREEDI